MYLSIYQFLHQYMSATFARPLAYALMVLMAGVVSFVVFFILRAALVHIMAKVSKRTKTKWDDILYAHKLYHRAAYLAIPFVLSIFATDMPQYGYLLQKAAQIIGVVVFLRVLETALGAANEIYNLYDISKTRPMRSLIQVVQVAAYIVGIIVIIALAAGESPLVLLGSIGAATAVTSFIFKDAILGFIAGLQLTANDMIRIGDWIEMPSCSADGTVIELTMTTVKVQNFDKTITSVPAYTLVSQAFINWRGMESAGGRRIKRAIYIDAGDVRLADDGMIQRFHRMALLEAYISKKLAEIEAYNKQHDFDPSEPVNGRRITNIGTFRAYVQAYLQQHPRIHKDMTIMVRQLDPCERGIPLEIYAFTDTTAWGEYENIQSDIFDHLYSVVPQFGLHVYQQPSGADIRSLDIRSAKNDTN